MQAYPSQPVDGFVLGMVEPLFDLIREFIHDRLPPNLSPFRGSFDFDDENGIGEAPMAYHQAFRFPPFCKGVIPDDVPAVSRKPVPENGIVDPTKFVLSCVGTKVVQIPRLRMDRKAIRHSVGGVRWRGYGAGVDLSRHGIRHCNEDVNELEGFSALALGSLGAWELRSLWYVYDFGKRQPVTSLVLQALFRKQCSSYQSSVPAKGTVQG